MAKQSSRHRPPRPRQGKGTWKFSWSDVDINTIALGGLIAIIFFRTLFALWDRTTRRVRLRKKRALVPNEILLVVMKELAKKGDLASLVSFMAASRRCYLLGLPVLLRDLDLLHVTDAWKLDAFLDTPLASRDKLRHVKTLRVWYDSHESGLEEEQSEDTQGNTDTDLLRSNNASSLRARAVLTILTTCAPHTETLGIWCYGGIAQEIWDLLPTFTNCKNLELCVSRGEVPWHKPSEDDNQTLYNDLGITMFPLFATDFPHARPGRPRNLEAFPPNLRRLALGSATGAGAAFDADDLADLFGLIEDYSLSASKEDFTGWSLRAPFVPEDAFLAHPAALRKLTSYAGCLLNGMRELLLLDDFRPSSLLVLAFDFAPDIWNRLVRLPGLTVLHVVGLPLTVEALQVLLERTQSEHQPTPVFPNLNRLILEFPRPRGDLDTIANLLERISQQSPFQLLIVEPPPRSTTSEINEEEDEAGFWRTVDVELVSRGDARLLRADYRKGMWPPDEFV